MPNFFLGAGADRWKTELGDEATTLKEFEILPGPEGLDDLVTIKYGADTFIGRTIISGINPLNNFIYFRRRLVLADGTVVFRHYFGKVMFHNPAATIKTRVKGFKFTTDANGNLITAGSPPVEEADGDDDWVATRPPMVGL